MTDASAAVAEKPSVASNGVSFNTHLCCGKVLCGHGDDDHYEGGCLEDHETETLKCGHLTCNFFPEEKYCRICGTEEEVNEEINAMFQDKEAVETLLKTAKSKSLRQCLSAWLEKVSDEQRESGNCNKRGADEGESSDGNKRGKKANDGATSTSDVTNLMEG